MKSEETANLNGLPDHASPRNLTAERISLAIENIPDYSVVDGSGFVRDVWNSFKEDVAEVFRKRSNGSAKNGLHPPALG
jgi:hypothetical protein